MTVPAACWSRSQGRTWRRPGRTRSRTRTTAPGRLDISSVEQGHSGRNVTHTITTFDNWPGSLLGRRTPNFLLIEISVDARPHDGAERAHHLVARPPGRRRASTSRRQFLGRANASRPNRHAVEVSIRRGLLGDPAGYRWRTLAFFEGESTCAGGCLDRAPNGSRAVHDLRAPFIAFPQPDPPADVTYDVEFTVRDAGGSGLAFWRLEQRIEDSGAAWNTVAEGSTTGLTSRALHDDARRVRSVPHHCRGRAGEQQDQSAPDDRRARAVAGLERGRLRRRASRPRGSRLRGHRLDRWHRARDGAPARRGRRPRGRLRTGRGAGRGGAGRSRRRTGCRSRSRPAGGARRADRPRRRGARAGRLPRSTTSASPSRPDSTSSPKTTGSACGS